MTNVACCKQRKIQQKKPTLTTGTMANVVSGCIWTLVATLFSTWPLSAPALASSYSMVNASRPVSSRTASVSTTSNTQSNTSWTLDAAYTHHHHYWWQSQQTDIFFDIITRDLWSFRDSIRIRIGRFRFDSKFSNQPHLPSYHDHEPRSLFNKKLQPLHRCNWDLFYVYDFMFVLQEHTHSLAQ